MKIFYQLLGNSFIAGVTNNFVWFALVFSVTGFIGLIITVLAMQTKQYKQLSKEYLK